MSSPIVDYVREIPLNVGEDYPMENTGFPFDDDREDSNATFRSQLDDIAARHPQFAQHLGSFPFTSTSRTRAHIPEEFTQQRFTDRPFPDRFERFAFPFDDEPLREEHKPYYQKYPKYYPQEHQQDNQSESASNSQEPESGQTEPVQETLDQEEPGRSRKLKNIQQSNTVDLGQRQEPVDDRNQRSMSAPPPNNRPRFVSSINIPVNQPKESPKAAPNMPQPSAPPQPQERVIPIHVEGRDEPIIPKRFATTSTSQPQTHQEPSQPYTDKFFTQRSPNFSQYLNRDKNFQNDWLPKNFQNKHPQAQTSQRGRSPQPQPKPETTHQQAVPEQTEAAQKHPAEAPPKYSSGKPDPIDQIKSIQKDVSALMAEVDKFAGQPKDKKYIYLDEMLTRNLIKLDDIDTQGQENIRLARKEAIKCIQKCISILESKANCNAADQEQQSKESDTTEPKEMEVESTKEEATEENRSMDVDKATKNEQISEENKNSIEEKMEVDAEKADGERVSVEKMETSEVNKQTGEPTELNKDDEDTNEKNNTIEPKKESESTIEENETKTELKDNKNTKNIKQKD